MKSDPQRFIELFQRLKDTDGRDRIVLRVALDGTPKLQLLEADGKVVSELPQNASNSTTHP